MSKKTPCLPDLLDKVDLRWLPPEPMSEGGLLEQGMLAVLRRHLPQDKSQAAFTRLHKAYDDWNEARVAQVQELAGHIRSKISKRQLDALREFLPAARDVKSYLQEVFQKTHGLELDFVREDISAAGKLFAQMPFLGLSTGSYLLWLANPEELPVFTGLVRVLDRLGLITRTTSVKKARVAIEPLVPKGDTLRLLTTIGEVAGRWCDARKPMCYECPLVDDCIHGRKVFKEWQAQQGRLEIQRQREVARRQAAEKKEEQRRLREAEAQRKKLEAEARKAERERDRKAKAEARERERLAKIKASEEAKKKAAAKKIADEKRRVAAQKKAAAKKKTAKKKVAKKKTTKRKTGGKKVTKRPAKASSKSRTVKKGTTKKKVARSKPATKRPATKKPVRKAQPKKAQAKKTQSKTQSSTRRKKSTPRRRR